MKKYVFFIIFLLFGLDGWAQFSLRITVTDVATKKGENVYVAGSFNGWNPKDEQYKLKPFGTTRIGIVLKNIPAGKYQFKLTRGSWDKVETSAEGNDIGNREIEVDTDANMEIKVAGWKDDYPIKPKPFTATAQVKIIDTAFAIPQLNRIRRIWLYLPKSYATSKKTYPVLYMQDGQNLFNEQTAAYGEWGVDECLDSLQKQTGKECIVVGIDHGGDKRMTEYNPYDNNRFGNGEGKIYVEFLVKTLKPFIDKKFRTQPQTATTFIAGSSMGGLISAYAMVAYPNVFGGAGIFSPSFWLTPEIYTSAEQTSWTTVPKFYCYAGEKESASMVADMDKFLTVLAKKPKMLTRRSVYPLGMHNEKAWRDEFDDFYKWIMR
jgi:metallo-beta-lactamase class B